MTRFSCFILCVKGALELDSMLPRLRNLRFIIIIKRVAAE